jgi:hypothetical protein
MIMKQVSRLLFVDNLATGAMAILCMQRAIKFMQESCIEWKLKINVKKNKIVVFKKGGKF